MLTIWSWDHVIQAIRNSPRQLETFPSDLECGKVAKDVTLYRRSERSLSNDLLLMTKNAIKDDLNHDMFT
jgi:hypothetical protein